MCSLDSFGSRQANQKCELLDPSQFGVLNTRCQSELTLTSNERVPARVVQLEMFRGLQYCSEKVEHLCTVGVHSEMSSLCR